MLGTSEKNMIRNKRVVIKRAVQRFYVDFIRLLFWTPSLTLNIS